MTIISENSLYRDPASRSALMQDKQLVMDAFIINFFGFLGLFKISGTRGYMRTYETTEGKLMLRNIGDTNHDVSLSIKLAVEAGLVQEMQANVMTKLLALIKMNQLKSKDIDETRIRGILDLIHYRQHKMSPQILKIISSFHLGQLSLALAAKEFYAVAKLAQFKGITTEFRGLVLKGMYTDLFKLLTPATGAVSTNTAAAAVTTNKTSHSPQAPAPTPATVVQADRYVNTIGTSNKFWAGIVVGSDLITSWGPLNGAGAPRISRKTLQSPADAQKALATAIREKLSKGYKPDGYLSIDSQTTGDSRATNVIPPATSAAAAPATVPTQDQKTAPIVPPSVVVKKGAGHEFYDNLLRYAEDGDKLNAIFKEYGVAKTKMKLDDFARWIKEQIDKGAHFPHFKSKFNSNGKTFDDLALVKYIKTMQGYGDSLPYLGAAWIYSTVMDDVSQGSGNFLVGGIALSDLSRILSGTPKWHKAHREILSKFSPAAISKIDAVFLQIVKKNLKIINRDSVSAVRRIFSARDYILGSGYRTIVGEDDCVILALACINSPPTTYVIVKGLYVSTPKPVDNFLKSKASEIGETVFVQASPTSIRSIQMSRKMFDSLPQDWQDCINAIMKAESGVVRDNTIKIFEGAADSAESINAAIESLCFDGVIVSPELASLSTVLSKVPKDNLDSMAKKVNPDTAFRLASLMGSQARDLVVLYKREGEVKLGENKYISSDLVKRTAKFILDVIIHLSTTSVNKDGAYIVWAISEFMREGMYADECKRAINQFNFKPLYNDNINFAVNRNICDLLSANMIFTSDNPANETLMIWIARRTRKFPVTSDISFTGGPAGESAREFIINIADMIKEHILPAKGAIEKIIYAILKSNDDASIPMIIDKVIGVTAALDDKKIMDAVIDFISNNNTAREKLTNSFDVVVKSMETYNGELVKRLQDIVVVMSDTLHVDNPNLFISTATNDKVIAKIKDPAARSAILKSIKSKRDSYKIDFARDLSALFVKETPLGADDGIAVINLLSELFADKTVYNKPFRDSAIRIIVESVTNLHETNPTEAEKMYKAVTGEMKRAMLDNIVGHMVLSDMSSVLYSKQSLIQPLMKLDQKRIAEILKYNSVNIPTIRINSPAGQSLANLKAAVGAFRQSIAHPKVTKTLFAGPAAKRTEYLERKSVEYDKFNKYVHGSIAVKILDEFDVHLPTQVDGVTKFKRENPTSEKIYPAFHGTGSIAASMILRFGFAVIKSRDTSVTGRMLGDGVYFSTVLDKVSQYVSDRGYSRGVGTKGYIFEMEAIIGESGKNFRAAGISGHMTHIRSPEWCVFSPNEQLRIKKAFLVEIISKDAMQELKKKHRKINEERVMEVKTFKSFLRESITPGTTNTTTFTFMDGHIPISKTEYVDFEKVVNLPPHVRIEPSGIGPMVIIDHNYQSSDAFCVSNTYDFMQTKEELGNFLKLVYNLDINRE